MPGLGFIPGRVMHLNQLGCQSRIPHVGWNDIQCTKAHPLLADIPTGTDFYFVHSYAVVPTDPDHIVATVHYGIPFPAVIAHQHILGVQFHPEKSAQAGQQLVKNFLAGNLC